MVISRSLYLGRLITRIECLAVGQQRSTLVLGVCGDHAQHLPACYSNPDGPITIANIHTQGHRYFPFCVYINPTFSSIKFRSRRAINSWSKHNTYIRLKRFFPWKTPIVEPSNIYITTTKITSCWLTIAHCVVQATCACAQSPPWIQHVIIYFIVL